MVAELGMEIGKFDPCWPNLDGDRVTWLSLDDFGEVLVFLRGLITLLAELYGRYGHFPFLVP